MIVELDKVTLNNNVITACNLSDNPIVKNTPTNISNFFETEKSIDKEYTWTFYDVESFQKLVLQKEKTPFQINELYWNDVNAQLQAYGIITYFRVSELLRSCIRLLNNDEIVSAATLARSILELSTVILENSNIYLKTVNSIKVEKGAVIIVEEFETMLLKNIWGTRHLVDEKDPLYQKNILTTLQKIAKHPDAKELMQRYGFLCELAHPNRIGNTRFWGDNWTTNPDNSYNIKISRRAKNFLNNETIENILWAISWGSECTKNGYMILQETILTIYLKLIKQ